MILSDFKRLIAPLQKKIFLSLGRAILKAVNNSEGTQKIQVVALHGETITDIERFQEYGFETYPFVDAESFVAFLNGNRDHGISLCTHDRRYRPKDLVEGEITIYTDEDQSSGGHRIHLKRGQIVEINCVDANINCIDANINCSQKANVIAAGGIDLDGGTGSVEGIVQADCICQFTGLPHSDVSSNVKGSK